MNASPPVPRGPLHAALGAGWRRLHTGRGRQQGHTVAADRDAATPGTDDELHRGRPLVGLIYLVFAYFPLLFWPDRPPTAIWVTLLATALFVPVYFAYYRARPRWRLPLALTVAGLGYALVPFNPGGNTLLIYAMGMAAALWPTRRAIMLALALVALLTAEYAWVLPRVELLVANVMVTVIIGGMVMAGAIVSRERERRNAELRLTQAEVRRLGAMAERERIGRDLHDLLGHTLSLIALKSELAVKLLDRDPGGHSARGHMGEVLRVAREALAQVREAVSGIRASSLDAELAAARLALLSAGIAFDQRIAPVHLAPEIEAALAMTLREAVTNILRHAAASAVEVELSEDAQGAMALRVSDNGCGGAGRFGNGLSGMRERVHAIGGALEVQSPSGAGTRLCLWVPPSALAARAP